MTTSLPDSGQQPPFTPPATVWQPPAPRTVPCPGCGRPVDPSQATLSAVIGQPICASCVANESLASAQARGAKSIAWGAFSAAAGGWMMLLMSSMFCSLGHIAAVACGIGAIVTGVRALRYLGREDQQSAANRGVLQAVTILGMIGGGLLVLFYAFGLLAVGFVAFARMH